MFNNVIYFCEPGDLYIIRPYDPHHPRRPLILSADQDLTFALQKYRFNPTEQNYMSLFRRELCFNFHITTYDANHTDHELLPDRLVGHPRSPLSITSSIDARLDTLVHALTDQSKLTIRYNSKLHYGCLMHSRCGIDQIHPDQLRNIFTIGNETIFTKPPLPADNPSSNSTPHTL